MEKIRTIVEVAEEDVKRRDNLFGGRGKKENLNRFHSEFVFVSTAFTMRMNDVEVKALAERLGDMTLYDVYQRRKKEKEGRDELYQEECNRVFK